MSPHIILMGDFNIHFDHTENSSTKDFKATLDCFGMTQYVGFPTHSKGHTLDLICCAGIIPSNIHSTELPVSDHKVVLFNATLTHRKLKVNRKMTYRNIRHIKNEDFMELITSYPSPVATSMPSDLVGYYNDCLSTALDALAPIKTRSVSFAHTAPWYTPELRQLKAKGRRLERLSNKTGLAVHKQMYSEHVLHYKNMLNYS